MDSYSTPIHFKYGPNYSIIFPFEKNFNKEYQREWMTHNWHVVIYFAIFYVVTVFGGQALMKSRPRYELRYPLAAWNAGLAIFSIMGTLRTMPEFAHVISNYGFHFSACNRSYADYNQISGFWGWLFVMSKVPEFFDTAFIVLRKQKLIFLHWYHHVATAVVLWFGYTDHSSLARWVVVMNYSVHSVMYGYFALRALKVPVPRWIAMVITSAQITQMILGVIVTITVQLTIWQGERCDCSHHVLYSTMLLYGSYFILFVNFFVQAYISKPSVTVVTKDKVQREINHNHLTQTEALKSVILTENGRKNGINGMLTKNGLSNGTLMGKKLP